MFYYQFYQLLTKLKVCQRALEHSILGVKLTHYSKQNTTLSYRGLEGKPTEVVLASTAILPKNYGPVYLQIGRLRQRGGISAGYKEDVWTY